MNELLRKVCFIFELFKSPSEKKIRVNDNMSIRASPRLGFFQIASLRSPILSHSWPSLAKAIKLQSVSWILAEFYFNRGLQRRYTGTCIILQKTINGFLCLLIVFLKSKTYQLILKDVIKLNRNLR